MRSDIDEAITARRVRREDGQLGAIRRDGRGERDGRPEHRADEVRRCGYVDGCVTRFTVAEEELLLPDEQHDDYRWLTPDALLASDNVHANSRAYFLSEKRAGVPGL